MSHPEDTDGRVCVDDSVSIHPVEGELGKYIQPERAQIYKSADTAMRRHTSFCRNSSLSIVEPERPCVMIMMLSGRVP